MEVLSAPQSIERLIRQKRTGLYFKGPGEWTDERADARRFDDLLGVFEVCSDCNLEGVELVLKDLEQDSEIRMELDPE